MQRKDRVVTGRPEVNQALHEFEERLTSIIELSSDWYWEQDENYRFTLATGGALEKSGIDPKKFLGKVRWAENATPISDDGSWDNHKATLEAHRPFYDFVYRNTGDQGSVRYLSVSGQPMFTSEGRFRGYRGIGKDVTQRILLEQRVAIEHGVTRVIAESTGIGEAGPQLIRVICETLGWTCGALWKLDENSDVLSSIGIWGMPSLDVDEFLATTRRSTLRAGDSKEPLLRACSAHAPQWLHDISAEKEFQRLGVAQKAGLRSAIVFPVIASEGNIGAMEIFTRDRLMSDRDLLNTLMYVGKSIGQFWERTRIERSMSRFGKMYAALNASNEAILRAKTPQEMFQWVCDAAVHGSKFSNATVVLADDDGKTATVVASAGKAATATAGGRLSFDEKVPEGRGSLGTAFRTQKPFVANDFLNDERLLPWREYARKIGWNSVATFPLIQRGRSIGVIGFNSFEKDEFDVELVALLQRVADNISFGLDNFQRDAERREAEERMKHMARHDMLTSLPNRAMFGELLNLALRSAERYQRGFAMLFIDLDGFKTVNDTLGHEAGDLLLKETSVRLIQVLRSSDVVARLGGDEFVALLQEVVEEKYVESVASKILAAIQQPVLIKGQKCRVTASIGVCMYPTCARDEASLMKNADAAMYRAKQKGKNTFEFYVRNEQF